MSKETISDRQGICLIILFISGEALSRKTAPAAGKDLWLAILLAIAVTLLFTLAYARLLSLFYGKDLFDILECLFGKFFGKLIGLLFAGYVFYTGAWVLRDFSEFPVTVSIPETPRIVLAIFMIALCIWIVKEGLETLSRWATLFVLLDAPLPSLAILLLIEQMDLNNIQPVLYEGIEPVIHGAFQAFSFPFAETVVFIMVLSSLKSKASCYKIYIKGLLLGGMLIAGVSLAEILVLGPHWYSALFFPNHAAASIIDAGEALQRLEMIAIIATITSTFVKISVYLLAACNGIAKIFNLKDYKLLVFPVGLMMCNITLFGDESIIDLFKMLEDVWPYFAFPFQVVLPLAILIIAEISQRRSGSMKEADEG